MWTFLRQNPQVEQFVRVSVYTTFTCGTYPSEIGSINCPYSTEHRCDGVVSNLRRVLGDTAIITVRRGWMLSSMAICAAEALLVTPDILF